MRKWVKTQPLRFMTKVNMSTLPSTQNTFSVLLDSICHGTVLITNCDKSQIATARITDLSQFFDCRNSKIDFNSTRGCTPKYRKQVHIDIRPFQGGFLGASFMDIITDIHVNIYTSEITSKWAKMQLFVFVSKVIMGTIPSAQNTLSVLLDSVCHVTALITNCDKSQIATAGIPDLSQFVTVAICDGSIYNFPNWCQ